MNLPRIVAAFLLVSAPLSAQGAFLGVSLESAEDGGATVLQVHELTAASIMGLQAGDVILAVGDQEVAGAEALGEILGDRRPGDLIHLTLRREGRVVRKPGILGRRPEELPSFEGGLLEASEVEDLDSFLQGLPPEEAERIRDLIDQGGGEVRIMRAPASIELEAAEEPEEVEVVEEPILVDSELEAVTGAWHGSLAAARKAASRSGKPVLVDFYADWCGPCRMLGDQVLHNEEWAALVGRFEPVQIDVDDHPELAEEFGVGGIPDLRVLAPNGEQVEQFVGFGGVESTVDKLGRAAEEHTRRRAAVLAPARPVQEEVEELASEEAELQARIEALRAEIAALRAEVEAMRDDG